MAPISDVSDRRPKTSRESHRKKTSPDEMSQASDDNASVLSLYRKAKSRAMFDASNFKEPGQVPKAAEIHYHKHAAGVGTATTPVRSLKEVEWNGYGANVGCRGDDKLPPTTVMPEDFRGTGKAIRKMPKFSGQSISKTDFVAPQADHVQVAHRNKEFIHAGELRSGRRIFTDITRANEMRDGSGLVGLGGWRATALLEEEDEEMPEEEKRKLRRAFHECSLLMPNEHPNARPVHGTSSEALKNYQPPMRRSQSGADVTKGRRDSKGSGASMASSRCSSASMVSKRSSRSNSHAGKESSHDRGKRRERTEKRGTSAPGDRSSRGSAASSASFVSEAWTIDEPLGKTKGSTNANRFKGATSQQAAYQSPPTSAYNHCVYLR